MEKKITLIILIAIICLVSTQQLKSQSVIEGVIAGAIVNRTFNYGTIGYKLTYTYNFGNRSLKVKRERSTGAEDELNRVHN